VHTAVATAMASIHGSVVRADIPKIRSLLTIDSANDRYGRDSIASLQLGIFDSFFCLVGVKEVGRR
jgi:hypothetical protein